MTDKKKPDDKDAAAPVTEALETGAPIAPEDITPDAAATEGAKPDDAASDAVEAEDIKPDDAKPAEAEDAKSKAQDEADESAPVRDPWDEPEAPVTAQPKSVESEVELEGKAEDPQAHDEPHDDFDDSARPSLAGRALRVLVIALVGGGAALWAAPKVAPMLPASVSRHLLVAVPVEVEQFNAYRAAASDRISGLEAALEDRAQLLGEQIETAGKSGLTEAEVDAAVAKATDALAARIAGLDATLANGDLSGLAARLSTLETQMAGLTRQLDSLAGGLENVGAQTGTVGEVSEAAVARLAANAAQIDGLRGQIDALAQKTGAMAQRLEQAETDAATRAATAEAEAEQRAAAATAAAEEVKAGAKARARMATINAAFDEIAASLDTGQPFVDGLGRIDATAPDALAATAASGVPTNAALRAAFTPAAHEAILAEALAGAQGGALDKLIAGVAAQFTGVPTVATEGDDAAAILGDVSGRLRDDDMTGALAVLATLPPAASAPMADWIARATLRRDAKTALADWRAALTKTDG